MDQDQLKQKAAEFALTKLPKNAVLGVGTGSTVNKLIDLLPQINPSACVASSVETQKRLEALGLEVMDLNQAGTLDVYVDGADEVNRHLQMIKGGGAALTREKIIAAASKRFIGVVDESKWVQHLGREFALPIEVIPMGRSYVARQIVSLGGAPEYRDGVVTDNGNHIIDVYQLDLSDPVSMERQINNIVGVVASGLFAMRPCDLLIMARASGEVSEISL